MFDKIPQMRFRLQAPRARHPQLIFKPRKCLFVTICSVPLFYFTVQLINTLLNFLHLNFQITESR